MWRLAFPFFLMRLVGAYCFTLVRLVVFRLAADRFAVLALLLTCTASVLATTLYVWSSPVSESAHPALGIDIQRSRDVTPLFLTVKMDELEIILAEQEQGVTEKPFISQNEYLNLAILSHQAGRYEAAKQYLEMAWSINPNRDFFVDTIR